AELKKHIAILDEHHFESLHFTSGLGTDLTVGLVKKHLWAGGDCLSTKGVSFVPNMPTEEVFCMPDKYNVNGKVYASKPLSYQGKVVEDFWFEFKDGKVVDYGAAREVEAIKALVEADEGSSRLGEVALISFDSPISRSNILFYNTLFDENASCHLALGASYPENVEGGIEMDDEQREANHSNNSMEHCDFMFGTADMKVTGKKSDGSEVVIFENGNFVF
ncbi:MAG: aminopeptidase, partial [Erysipelotrichaceae bacterium]|nr:aminopeptidase [Erysipelotrichaceae bacterium]